MVYVHTKTFMNRPVIFFPSFTSSYSFFKAIGSLIELMRLMGPKYITQVKMKVLAMLR